MIWRSVDGLSATRQLESSTIGFMTLRSIHNLSQRRHSSASKHRISLSTLECKIMRVILHSSQKTVGCQQRSNGQLS